MRRLPLVLLALAAPASAQDTWLPINVGIHAASAGVRAVATGRSPWRAMLGGAAGGVVGYAGQRLIGTDRPEFRFLGQQAVAVGASMAVNAGAGVPEFSRVTLPVYPFYVRIDKGVRVQLSAASALTLLVYATAAHGRLDLRESALTGAPVFGVSGAAHLCVVRAPDGCTRWRRGYHIGGITLLDSDGYWAGGGYAPGTVAHEAGHQAQHTRDALLHALPMSDRVTHGFLALDFALPLHAASRMGEWYETEVNAIQERGRQIK